MATRRFKVIDTDISIRDIFNNTLTYMAPPIHRKLLASTITTTTTNLQLISYRIKFATLNYCKVVSMFRVPM